MTRHPQIGSVRRAARVCLASLATAALLPSAFAESRNTPVAARPRPEHQQGVEWHASAVRPLVERVTRGPGGTFVAVFGYQNDGPRAVTTPVGIHNAFFPGRPDRGQPRTFQPGRVRDAFQVAFERRFLFWKLVPLVGGSGGGGGNVEANGTWGGSGGAGGGALLIASSTYVMVSGQILADGGGGGAGTGTCPALGSRGFGGAGAGGAIRIVTPRISGSGTLAARGASGACGAGSEGGKGRIRLEAFSHEYSFSTPSTNLSQGAPVSLFLPSAPSSVRVVSIAGVPVPANPSGSFELPDVTIQEGAATIVEIEARNVPPGTAVSLHLFSLGGDDQVVESEPLAGTPEISTTTASVVFPPGFTRGFARAVWR